MPISEAVLKRAFLFRRAEPDHGPGLSTEGRVSGVVMRSMFFLASLASRELRLDRLAYGRDPTGHYGSPKQPLPADSVIFR